MTRRAFLVRVMALVAAPAALVARRRDGESVPVTQLSWPSVMPEWGEIYRVLYTHGVEYHMWDGKKVHVVSRSLYESQQQRKARRA